MTSTSSPHLIPDDVARHTFASARRGFDPAEVRDYLESLAAGLQAQAQRERELIDALADAEERAANPVIDDAMLTNAVGRETARVLQSAHEASAEMVANVEAETTRKLADAQTESERLLAEATRVNAQAQARADELLAERTSEAEAVALSLQERTEQQVAAALDKVRADAEELTERARAEGRVMVEEAQQLRARVLADLSRRRKVLHSQIEQLRAGRERLAETITDVRRSVDTIAEDLFNAENEARLAAEVAGREAAARPDDDGTLEELAASLLAEETADMDAAEGDLDGDGAADKAGVDLAAPNRVSGDGGDAVVDEPEDGAPAGAPVEKVDALFAKLRAAQGDEVAIEPVADGSTGEASAVADEADEADGSAGPPEARHPLAVQRDELIAPIVTGLSRRLKRSLQDNQNDLLDKLRGKGVTWSVDLLPSETEHIDSFTTCSLPFLEEAADAGISLVGNSKKRPSTDALLAVANELAEAIVVPIRRRLTDLEGVEGVQESVVSEHVGSAFREWKGERIERLAGDHVVAAFSIGTMVVVGKGSIEWVSVAAPGASPCPDCEDNGLNGAQSPGEEFPTGHAHPPAHPGCRCLLAPGTP